MPSSIAHRLLAAALMAAAAFAQPGEALTHGIAHEREHHREHHHEHSDEHRAEHQQGSGHEASKEHPQSLGWASPDHAHGHVHADVDDASIRNRIDPAAIVYEVELPDSAVCDVVVDTPSPSAPIVSGAPATGPPPRLRAPPVR